MKYENPFKKGVNVRVIDETLTGKVVKIEGYRITITSEDGFLYTFNHDELVLCNTWDDDFKLSSMEKRSLPKKKVSITKSKKRGVIHEIDLHLHELTDSEKGMTNFDKLSLQLNTARKFLETAIEKKYPRIIFIHGYGSGVLKKELSKLLNKYPVNFQDAPYSEYGLGATEVNIFQNPKYPVS